MTRSVISPPTAAPVASPFAVVAEMPITPAGNTAALERLRRFGGDALLREMIDLFLFHTPKRIEALRAALRDADPRAVRLAAHSMTSSCAQMGAEQLRELSARAERLADQPALLDTLPDEMEAALAPVRHWLESVRAATQRPA